MTNEVLLEARGLVRRYGRHVALAGIDLVLRRGEVLGFLGLNGAGKSTTMQILAGALAAHGGSVRIAGHDLSSAPRAARAALGYLPQTPPVVDDMTVDEYLALCARLRGVGAQEVPDACARARAHCSLDEVRTRLVRHLSQGYRQRLGLAQAIVHEPTVLILDEPTTGLDPAQIRDVHAFIARLGRQRAIVLSTHILSEVRELASRIVILHGGRIVHDMPRDGASTGLRLCCSHPPDLAGLLAVEGVGEASPAADGAWLVRAAAGDARTLAPALASAAVRGNWGLRSMQEDDALEDLFLRLTSNGTDPWRG